jgi:hypothetical protein
VKFNKVAALVVVVGILSPCFASANGLDDAVTAQAAAAASAAANGWAPAAPHLKRPAVLPVLYVALGAIQAWDVMSTSAAIKAGAHEGNQAAAPFANNTGALLSLKAVTTASTLFFAERAWKKNRVAAVVMMVAINSGIAAVSVTNMRNTRKLANR